MSALPNTDFGFGEPAVVATFTHEHRGGITVYTAIVPESTTLPMCTIGGECPVDDEPEEWALYQTFIKLLGISFDENDEQDFLTCSSEPVLKASVLSASEIDAARVPVKKD